MRRQAAFTLIEMLAVIAIMLILMTATFGMFSMFSEQIGPESLLSTVQALMNGTRDYAATNGVSTRLLFETTAANDPQKVLDGTRITMQRWSSAGDEWESVPGRRSVDLHGNMFVLKEIPAISGLAGNMPLTARLNPNLADIEKWKKFDRDVRLKVQEHGLGSGGKPKSEHNGFVIEFSPSGYPPSPGNEHTPSNRIVGDGLTIIRVVGEEVTGYAFYPINTNTGTRLIFE